MKSRRVGRTERHSRLHPCHSKIVQLARIDRAPSTTGCKESLPRLTVHTTVLRDSFSPPKGAVAVNFPKVLMIRSVPARACASYHFVAPYRKDKLMGPRAGLICEHRRGVCILRGNVGIVSNPPRLNGIRELAVR